MLVHQVRLSGLLIKGWQFPNKGEQMKQSLFIFITASILLTGCLDAFVPIKTVETTGVKNVEAAVKINEVPPENAKDMQNLGEVIGYSCKNKLWDPEATAEAATHQVKLAAAMLGATAITDLTCSEGTVSLAKNCWQSFTCKANALR